MNVDYQEAQRVVREELGIGESTSSLLDRWTSLIDECEEGYRWDRSEYLNEVRARDMLEKIATAGALEHFPEHRTLVDEIRKLDARFVPLVISDAVNLGTEGWWRNVVLRKAGCDYADSLGERGTMVEVIDC